MAAGKAILLILAILIIATTIYYATKPVPTQELTIDIRSNTEYYDGDTGKVITLLTNNKGDPVTATCQASITYPDGTYFINNAAMTPTTLGGYETTFTVPPTDGVYEYTANCTLAGKNYLAGKSFHVSNSTSIILQGITSSTEELQATLSSLNNTLIRINTTLNEGQTSINTTVTQFQNQTENTLAYIISLLENTTTNTSLTSITNQLTNLTTIVLQFQNQTQVNFSQVINLISAANTSILTSLDQCRLYLQQVNNSIHIKLDNLEYQHNQTQEFLINMNITLTNKIDSIIGALNITGGDMNVYVTANDCYLNDQWLIQAQVTNQFGVQYSSPPVYCNVTTQLWGASTMTYNGALKLFEYTHVCDVAPQIEWTVDCVK